MQEYYIGTSAYKLDEYESYAKESNKRHEERKEAVKAQSKANYKLVSVVVLFLFVAASALVYLNVMSMRTATEKEQLKKEIAMIEDSNKQKEIEINKMTDMKVIEKKAVDELDMRKPDNSQIIYVDVKKENTETVVSAETDSEGGFWDSVCGWFGDVWEYFC